MKAHPQLKWLLSGLAVIILMVSALWLREKNSYELLSPKIGPVEESIYGLGKVKSWRIFEYKMGIMMAIRKLHVKEGEKVTPGQPLVAFEDGRQVSAPFTGTITALPFHEKENVFPQSVILRLEDLDDCFVEIAMEQQGILRVQKGQNAVLSFESLRGQKFQGTVFTVYPSGDEFLVRINVKDLPKEILPGMTSDVAILVGKKEKALLIPTKTLSNGKVIRWRNGKKEKVEISAGASDGEWMEVVRGDILASDKLIAPAK